MFSRTPKSMMVVFSNCKDPAREDEYNRWYETVRLPRMLAVPGVLAAERYQCAYRRAGAARHVEARYIGVYELDVDADGVRAFEDRLQALRRQEEVAGERSSLIDVPVGGVFVRLGEEHKRPGAASAKPNGLLVIVSNCADPSRIAEFHRWYDTVHIPHVLEVPGVLSAQRYQCIHQRQGRSGFMAAYDLEVADYAKLDQDLKDMVTSERAQGLRPVPDLNDHVVSNFYAPFGKKQRARR